MVLSIYDHGRIHNHNPRFVFRITVTRTILLVAITYVFAIMANQQHACIYMQYITDKACLWGF